MLGYRDRKQDGEKTEGGRVRTRVGGWMKGVILILPPCPGGCHALKPLTDSKDKRRGTKTRNEDVMKGGKERSKKGK